MSRVMVMIATAFKSDEFMIDACTFWILNAAKSRLHCGCHSIPPPPAAAAAAAARHKNSRAGPGPMALVPGTKEICLAVA
ncbi:hypothetical protein MY11210_008074 [Beauveria gryllotalpidicola]